MRYGDQEYVKCTSILMPNPGSAKETLLELYQLSHLLEDPQKYHQIKSAETIHCCRTCLTSPNLDRQVLLNSLNLYLTHRAIHYGLWNLHTDLISKLNFLKVNSMWAHSVCVHVCVSLFTNHNRGSSVAFSYVDRYTELAVEHKL